MSELKVYVKPIKTNMFGKMIVGQSYYLKSEADKVIAEKDEKIRHHKYKRCLGIAAVCFEKSYSTTLVKYDKESGLFRNFYDWWGKRWLELAEKFKEAK